MTGWRNATVARKSRGKSGGPKPGRDSGTSSNGGSAQIAVTWRRMGRPRRAILGLFSLALSLHVRVERGKYVCDTTAPGSSNSCCCHRGSKLIGQLPTSCSKNRSMLSRNSRSMLNNACLSCWRCRTSCVKRWSNLSTNKEMDLRSKLISAWFCLSFSL